MYNNKDNFRYRWKSFINWHAVAAILLLKQAAHADELANFYQLNNLDNPLTETLNNFKEGSRYLQKPQFAKLILAKQNAKASKMDVLKNEYYLPDQYIPPYFSSANPDFLFHSQLPSVSDGFLRIEFLDIIPVLSIFKSFEDIIYARLQQIEIPLAFVKSDLNDQEEFFDFSQEFNEEFFSNMGENTGDEKPNSEKKDNASSKRCNIPEGFAKPAICFLAEEWQQAYEEFASSPFAFRGMAGDRIDEFVEFLEAAWGWANSWFNFD
jgi:hypothetical protein